MSLSLGIYATFSSDFRLITCNLKLINTMDPVSPNSLTFSLFSIVGTIALGFLTGDTVIHTNSAFHNGDFLWKAPSPLRQRPTATRMPSPTPTLLSPSAQTKQILAAVATVCALLVGSAYVMYLASQNSFSSSSEPATDRQHFAQRDRFRYRDPAPWPLPPPSRRPLRSQPPNRRPGFSSIGGIPRKVNTPHNRPLARPFREDPPPPPPPSLAGFIEDFPKPRNFEELIIMNIMLGALLAWTLKKLFGYPLGRKTSEQKIKTVSSSLPKRATTSSIPRNTGDRLSPTRSRSRLPERRKIPLPLGPQRSTDPVSVFLMFTLAGSGTLVLFGLKARHHATNVPIVPLTVVRSHDRDSTFASPVLHKLDSSADTSYLDRLPSSQTTPTPNRRRTFITRRSPSAVRLSQVEQVKYFYKDEVIGFENGPRPRGRSSTVS